MLWALLRPEAFTPDRRCDPVGRGREGQRPRPPSGSARTCPEACASLSPRSPTARSPTCAGAASPTPPPRALFADALRIAYRLLFVAYAEDRGLLPVGTPVYDSGYSLRACARVTDPSVVWEPDGGHLWGALRAQWGLLRDGADAGELKITGFNGGLFDSSPVPDPRRPRPGPRRHLRAYLPSTLSSSPKPPAASTAATPSAAARSTTANSA